MIGHTEQNEGVLYCNGAPFEGIGDAELEPVHPDDVPEPPELTLTFTPEQAAAIVETLKPAFEELARIYREFAEWAAEVLRKVAAVAGERAAKFIEAELYFANDNPKWWHLYKHAKKARTRKKYRRRLMEQLLRTLATGSAGQEVRA